MKYTKLISSLLIVLSSSISIADCNLKVAIAAGQYLEVLERSELRRYQNNSVCEVLDYEFWSCSETQIKKLESTLNIKEILGNYCQPHLPPPKNAINKDHFMKGADLYSWREPSGYVWYSLLPGTNRNKSVKEITENKVTVGYLKVELKKLPKKTYITWNNLVGVEDKSSMEFTFPENKTVKEIVKSAEAKDLNISIIK